MVIIDRFCSPGRLLPHGRAGGHDRRGSARSCADGDRPPFQRRNRGRSTSPDHRADRGRYCPAGMDGQLKELIGGQLEQLQIECAMRRAVCSTVLAAARSSAVEAIRRGAALSGSATAMSFENILYEVSGSMALIAEPSREAQRDLPRHARRPACCSQSVRA